MRRIIVAPELLRIVDGDDVTDGGGEVAQRGALDRQARVAHLVHQHVQRDEHLPQRDLKLLLAPVVIQPAKRRRTGPDFSKQKGFHENT